MVIFCKLIVWCIVESSSGTVVRAEVAEATSSIPVLGETLLRILWVVRVVGYGDHTDASFWADPGANAASCALAQIEEVTPSESVW